MNTHKMIKEELNKAFPGIEFNVTGDCNTINVRWTNGAAYWKVREITSKYEIYKFSEDSFEFDEELYFGKVNHVLLSRQLTEAIYQSKFEDFKNDYEWADINDKTSDEIGCPRKFIRGELSDICL